MSPNNGQHPLEPLCHQCRGSWTGDDCQYRGHAAEGTTTLGGHVSRMEDHRLPKITQYGELSYGHRDKGAPKKRYKDSLRKSLGVCHIDCSQWSALAADRAAWRYTVHQAVSSFEASRKEDLGEKRRRRKIRAASTAASEPCQTFDCSHCGRTCLSRIGLVSHQRACNRRGQPPLFILR